MFTCRMMLTGSPMDQIGLLAAMNHVMATGHHACCRCNICGSRGNHTKQMCYLNRRNNPDGVHKWTEAMIRTVFARNDEAYEVHRRDGKDHATAMKLLHDSHFKWTGWKCSPPFAALPYFRLSRDFWIDPMHQFMNFGRKIHTALAGDDITEKTRRQTKAWGEHRTWWPENATFISPSAIPSTRRNIGGEKRRFQNPSSYDLAGPYVAALRR